MTVLIILFAILLFSVIIFIHELGHFIAARIFGVTVHEFAIGMGPALWKHKGKRETIYSVRCIPIGGFCAMEGGDSDKPGSFATKSKLARFIILAAGAFMNVVLGFIISLIVVIMTCGGGIATNKVDSVVPDAPAAKFLQPGDKIVEINGHGVNIQQEISVGLSLGDSDNSFDVKVRRNGKTLSFNDIKVYEQEKDGVKNKMIGIICAVDKPSVISVLRESFFQTVYMGKVVFLSLSMLFHGEAKMSDLSGPVGVVEQMGNAAKSGGGGIVGFINLLYLAGFISVNIGIMNLLPFPALDGGRILFIVIELVTRRRIPAEKEGNVHFIGIILLFGLMIFATWNDILRLLS